MSEAAVAEIRMRLRRCRTQTGGLRDRPNRRWSAINTPCVAEAALRWMLADGADFAVDLIGVYGKPEYVHEPG